MDEERDVGDHGRDGGVTAGIAWIQMEKKNKLRMNFQAV